MYFFLCTIWREESSISHSGYLYLDYIIFCSLFSRTFSLKKSCQKAFIFTWQIRDPITFLPQDPPWGWNTFQYLTDQSNIRKEHGWGTREVEVLAEEAFAYLWSDIVTVPMDFSCSRTLFPCLQMLETLIPATTLILLLMELCNHLTCPIPLPLITLFNPLVVPKLCIKSWNL